MGDLGSIPGLGRSPEEGNGYPLQYSRLENSMDMGSLAGYNPCGRKESDTMETVRGFIFLGSKITADGDCSHEIKRYLLLRRKAMTNLDTILKKETLLCNKGPSSQSYDFSSSHVWMESWNIKKAEC